jgi:hypothetical protein
LLIPNKQNFKFFLLIIISSIIIISLLYGIFYYYNLNIDNTKQINLLNLRIDVLNYRLKVYNNHINVLNEVINSTEIKKQLEQAEQVKQLNNVVSVEEVKREEIDFNYINEKAYIGLFIVVTLVGLYNIFSKRI